MALEQTIRIAVEGLDPRKLRIALEITGQEALDLLNAQLERAVNLSSQLKSNLSKVRIVGDAEQLAQSLARLKEGRVINVSLKVSGQERLEQLSGRLEQVLRLVSQVKAELSQLKLSTNASQELARLEKALSGLKADRKFSISLQVEGQKVLDRLAKRLEDAARHASELRKELARVGLTGDADQEVARLEKELARVNARLKELEGEGKAAAEALRGVAASSTQHMANVENLGRQSTYALISLNQLVQDLPYGLRGIANNIEVLVQQLVFLRGAAAAAGTSLSSLLLGALRGPAGFLLAINAVIAALVAFGDNISRIFGRARYSTDQLRQAFDELGLSLDRLSAQSLARLESAFLAVRDQAAEVLKAMRDVRADLSSARGIIPGDAFRQLEEVQRRSRQLLQGAQSGAQGPLAQWLSGLSEDQLALIRRVIDANNELIEQARRQAELRQVINLLWQNEGARAELISAQMDAMRGQLRERVRQRELEIDLLSSAEARELRRVELRRQLVELAEKRLDLEDNSGLIEAIRHQERLNSLKQAELELASKIRDRELEVLRVRLDQRSALEDLRIQLDAILSRSAERVAVAAGALNAVRSVVNATLSDSGELMAALVARAIRLEEAGHPVESQWRAIYELFAESRDVVDELAGRLRQLSDEQLRRLESIISVPIQPTEPPDFDALLPDEEDVTRGVEPLKIWAEEFARRLESALQSALRSFVSGAFEALFRLAEGVRSFSDAVRALFSSVAAGLRRMAAEMIAMKLVGQPGQGGQVGGVLGGLLGGLVSGNPLTGGLLLGGISVGVGLLGRLFTRNRPMPVEVVGPPDWIPPDFFRRLMDAPQPVYVPSRTLIQANTRASVQLDRLAYGTDIAVKYGY